jgi:hypothetical protein
VISPKQAATIRKKLAAIAQVRALLRQSTAKRRMIKE